MTTHFVRLLADSRNNSSIVNDAITRQLPFWWSGNAFSLQLALAVGSTFLTAADVGTITLEIKPVSASATSAPLVRKVFAAVDCDSDFVGAQWEQAVESLLVAEFTEAEASLGKGRYRLIVIHEAPNGTRSIHASTGIDVTEDYYSGPSVVSPPPVASEYDTRAEALTKFLSLNAGQTLTTAQKTALATAWPEAVAQTPPPDPEVIPPFVSRAAAAASGLVNGDKWYRLSDGQVFLLVPPPFVPASSLAFFGDSQTDRYQLSGETVNSFSYANWLGILNGAQTPYTRNTARGDWDFGYSGETSLQLLSRLPDVKSSGADCVVIQAGINSISSGLTAEETVADTVALWDDILADGQKVIAIALWPSGLVGLVDIVNDTNAGLATEAATRGVPFLTYDNSLRVNGDAAREIDPVYLTDNTHLSGLGALRIATQLQPQIEPLLVRNDPFLPQDDPRWVTQNSHFEDGDGSGSIPPSWQKIGPASIAYAVIAATDGGPDWVEATVTGNAGQLSWLRNFTASDFVVGDVVEAIAEVEVLAGSDFNVFSLALLHQTGGVTQVVNSAPNGSTEFADAFAGVLKTNPLAIPAGTTQQRHQIQFNGNGAFRFRKAGVFKSAV